MPAILFVHGVQDDIYPVSDIENCMQQLVPYYEQVNQ